MSFLESRLGPFSNPFLIFASSGISQLQTQNSTLSLALENPAIVGVSKKGIVLEFSLKA